MCISLSNMQRIFIGQADCHHYAPRRAAPRRAAPQDALRRSAQVKPCLRIHGAASVLGSYALSGVLLATGATHRAASSCWLAHKYEWWRQWHESNSSNCPDLRGYQSTVEKVLLGKVYIRGSYRRFGQSDQYSENELNPDTFKSAKPYSRCRGLW